MAEISISLLFGDKGIEAENEDLTYSTSDNSGIETDHYKESNARLKM